MSGESIAQIIIGIGTVIASLYGAIRLARSDKVKSASDNAAVLLSGWEALKNSTTEEMERVKKSCAEEIAKMKADHDKDREDWDRDRVAMQDRIETLEAKVVALLARLDRNGKFTRKDDPK